MAEAATLTPPSPTIRNRIGPVPQRFVGEQSSGRAPRFGCRASRLARQSWGRMVTVALTRAERQRAADLIQTLLDLVDDGDLAADGPSGVALVRRLEGAMLALRAMDGHGTSSQT
jgi:hypothetical protein